MSDNNADFNGAGQVNNPTSDNAAQADYNQPYIPQQNDAQMNHPESQPETPAYDQNSAAYTQTAQSAEPAVPAYDPNASAYSQYGQTAQSAQSAQPSYGQPATPAPAYGTAPVYTQPAQSAQPSYGQPAAPAYDPNNAYAQPDYNQANYGQQGYAAPSYNQSAYTQPAYAQQPAYGQPVAPAGYAQKSKLAARSAWHLPGLLRRAQLLLGQHRQGRGTAAADRHRLDSHHRPSRRRHLGTGGRHPDSVLPLRLAMAP